MKKIQQIHSQCIALYVAIPACTILLTVLCAKFLHFLPPFQMVAALICSPPLVCGLLRLKLWKNRDALLSREELDSRTAKVFFWSIPGEISFFVIAIGFILSS